MYANGLVVRIFPNAERAAQLLARDIAGALRQKPALVLGLPTGRTPIPLYQSLRDLVARGKADFAHATTFNLDEFLGIPASDARSYRQFMERHLFSGINLPRRHIRFLDGTASDPLAEAARYERAIARAGGLDLLVLGLGANGHIGFNEPASALVTFTHVCTLKPATRRANAEWFGGRASQVPAHALSMGMGTILKARRIVLLATGPDKAGAIRRLVEGRVTTRLPASFLQLHPCAEVWLDREAAAGLSGCGKRAPSHAPQRPARSAGRARR